MLEQETQVPTCQTDVSDAASVQPSFAAALRDGDVQ